MQYKILALFCFCVGLFAQPIPPPGGTPTGANLPASAREGQLFTKTGSANGLYVVTGGVWVGPMATSAGSSPTGSAGGDLNLTYPNPGVAKVNGVAASAVLVRTCIITTGDPGAASPVLVDDNDSPQVCKNKTGATMTITSVSCYADAGSPTVTPILSGGGATSILSGALTCSQTSGGAAGTLNGTPTLTSNSTIDANITTAGGTAKYTVITIGMTL